jgi:hypothetical protein
MKEWPQRHRATETQSGKRKEDFSAISFSLFLCGFGGFGGAI